VNQDIQSGCGITTSASQAGGQGNDFSQFNLDSHKLSGPLKHQLSRPIDQIAPIHRQQGISAYEGKTFPIRIESNSKKIKEIDGMHEGPQFMIAIGQLIQHPNQEIHFGWCPYHDFGS
jgi:hypothetical protein